MEKKRPTNLKYKLDDVSRGMGVETYTHGKRGREVGKKKDCRKDGNERIKTTNKRTTRSESKN